MNGYPLQTPPYPYPYGKPYLCAQAIRKQDRLSYTLGVFNTMVTSWLLGKPKLLGRPCSFYPKHAASLRPRYP